MNTVTNLDDRRPVEDQLVPGKWAYANEEWHLIVRAPLRPVLFDPAGARILATGGSVGGENAYSIPVVEVERVKSGDSAFEAWTNSVLGGRASLWLDCDGSLFAAYRSFDGEGVSGNNCIANIFSIRHFDYSFILEKYGMRQEALQGSTLYPYSGRVLVGTSTMPSGIEGSDEKFFKQVSNKLARLTPGIVSSDIWSMFCEKRLEHYHKNFVGELNSEAAKRLAKDPYMDDMFDYYDVRRHIGSE